MQWIRCDERMPEPGIPVLVTNGVDITTGVLLSGDWSTHGVDGYDLRFFWDDAHLAITHRMPLPRLLI